MLINSIVLNQELQYVDEVANNYVNDHKHSDCTVLIFSYSVMQQGEIAFQVT